MTAPAPITPEWLAELKKLDRYAGVDLDQALHKCRCWACGGKMPTRNRFVRYLDKNHGVKHQPFEKPLPN